MTKNVRKLDKMVTSTVKQYPASTSTPFIVLFMNELVNRGWIGTDLALAIIAAWPAAVTLWKEKVAPLIWKKKLEEEV